MIKMSGRALPLILAATGLSLALAHAQTLPWPDAPGAGTMAAPMTAPNMAPPMQPPQGPPAGSAQEQCATQFANLRTSAEKLGAAAKAASDRKVSREELCKHVQAFAAAEARWVKFTNDNVTKCGIPSQIAAQLSEGHSRTLVARKNICSAGPGPGRPAAPSLSDALGTSRMSTPEGSRSGRGTLDTLTGNPIAR